MAAPTSWAAPAAGTVDAIFGALSYAGGYWFAFTYVPEDPAPQVPTLRYTTDPTGSWSTATLPTPSSPYDIIHGRPVRHGVVHGNGQYAFGMSYADAAGTATETYSFSATTPGGTWSSTQIDASNDLACTDYVYADGLFVAVGGGVTTSNPWIAYSTAADGAWTVNTSEATTGYDPTGDWRIEGVDYDGGSWVTVASGPVSDGARHSSSLTSSWGTVSSFPTALSSYVALRYVDAASTWVVADRFGTDFHYSTEPSGAWSTAGSALTGMTNAVGALTYGAGYWIAGGDTRPVFYSEPRLAYLAGRSPDATFTAIDNPFTEHATDDVYVLDVLWANDYVVALAAVYGEIRYCYLPARRAATLRQRQSPKWTPSRVRSTDLRQRQSPYL